MGGYLCKQVFNADTDNSKAIGWVNLILVYFHKFSVVILRYFELFVFPLPALYSCFSPLQTVQIHTVNPCVDPEGTVGAILSPLSFSIETHRFPSAVKSAEMLVVACHSYWQRPCKTHWVQQNKAPVNLKFPSLTPVDRLWCKQSASRALVWPIQTTVCLLLWCNSVSCPISSLYFGFLSTCISVSYCGEWEC